MSKKAKPKPSSTGTARAVLDAFMPAEVRIAGVVLQPLMIAHFMALEKIGSPLVSNKPTTTHDVVAGLLLLSRPAREAKRTASQPEQAFSDLVDELAARIPAIDLLGAGEKLQAHVDGAFATAPLPSNAEGGEGGPLPSSPETIQAKGSAGSSR